MTRRLSYTHVTGGERFVQSIYDPLPDWAYDVRPDPEDPFDGACIIHNRVADLPMPTGWINLDNGRICTARELQLIRPAGTWHPFNLQAELTEYIKPAKLT